jgi:hypothetical protein
VAGAAQTAEERSLIGEPFSRAHTVLAEPAALVGEARPRSGRYPGERLRSLSDSLARHAQGQENRE